MSTENDIVVIKYIFTSSSYKWSKGIYADYSQSENVSWWKRDIVRNVVNALIIGKIAWLRVVENDENDSKILFS